MGEKDTGGLVAKAKKARDVLARGQKLPPLYPSFSYCLFVASQGQKPESKGIMGRLKDWLQDWQQAFKEEKILRKAAGALGSRSFASIIRDDANGFQAYCLLNDLQLGGNDLNPGARKAVEESLVSFYHFLGLERYAFPEVVSEALARLEEGIKPIKPEIIYALNESIGPYNSP